MRLARRRIAGKRFLVTGASSGVGRAVAAELAARGARVFATARRQQRLDDLAHTSDSISVLAGDICDPEFRPRLVAAAATALWGLDGVVAAAGGGAIGRFRDLSPDTFARVMDLDFSAPAELVRTALPTLSRGDDPVIVFIGSILGLHPLPLHGEYCAAKAALRSLAGTLRSELAADGIGVLLVDLGPTQSEFWEGLLAGQRPPWSRGRRMPAEAAARAIAAAIERRRAEIVPGWQARGYALAARFMPRLIDRAAARHLRTGRDRPPRSGPDSHSASS
ncbi:MAG: SDR family NAD(P)-dependent oxidoreductase [Planctomycetaceae bacterium]